jgi:hypothetical protein
LVLDYFEEEGCFALRVGLTKLVLQLDKKLLTLFLALNMLSNYFQFGYRVLYFVNMSS